MNKMNLLIICSSLAQLLGLFEVLLPSSLVLTIFPPPWNNVGCGVSGGYRLVENFICGVFLLYVGQYGRPGIKLVFKGKSSKIPLKSFVMPVL